ncbi:M56 family metallopeptidase [Dyadobacter psychrotolerans]|uniref:M56 family metallopeptidase n=1 Tax=Dyadobacter psychrotolerans TaxID=2541721 RepID=A0A4V2Z4V0_9BACT|nr:M56 family metallopeptidase [Dyadobacter psychrotolerans]TDE18138.1 M56 family metallopeptidase [Dyadobacter psychrotolerans]
MTSYIIKSILCSGILLAVYHLFLQKEKMCRFNRFYLLAGIVFSLVVPLVSIELESDSIPTAISKYDRTSNFVMDLTVRNVAVKSDIDISKSDTNWLEYAPISIYIFVVLLLLARLIRNLRIIFSKKYGTELIFYQGINIVLLPEPTVTFTFLNHIFVNKNDYLQKLIEDEVLIHEMAHVRQKHSLDILFIEVIQALYWFNPFFFFYKKAIQLNHEFLADEAVISKHFSVSSYQLMLLDKILCTKQVNLTSSFNYSITKQRLAMMTRTSNKTIQMLKKLATPLLTLCIAFVFCEKIYSQEKGNTAIKKAEPVMKSGNIRIADKSIPTKRPKGLYEQKSGPGLSAEKYGVFISTIENHTKYVTSEKGLKYSIVEMSSDLENQMYDLYMLMTKDQQIKVYDSGITIFKMDMPVKKAPTPEMFENWKKPTVFGIWINDKHVPNSALDKYKYSDIAEYDLSKLYGAALKGRIYKYQLNLLTNDYFDKTYDYRVKNLVLISK